MMQAVFFHHFYPQGILTSIHTDCIMSLFQKILTYYFSQLID